MGSMVREGSQPRGADVDADVNGYWLQTDGVIDGMWQSSRLSRKRHGVFRYRLVDISFPDKLPSEIFAPAKKNDAGGGPSGASTLARAFAHHRCCDRTLR